MMFGFFPPGSSDTFLNNGAHASATFLPVAVPPVNEMVLIFGCAVMAAPTFGPVPCTILSTPFGRPASRASEDRSEEHTSELQSHHDLVCRLLLEKKNEYNIPHVIYV